MVVEKRFIKKLFVKQFENTFFCFEDFTFRAMPPIRDILPCCIRWYILLGISFQRIINIVTFETHASDIFFCLCHDRFIPKTIARCNHLFFSCILMNSFKKATAIPGKVYLPVRLRMGVHSLRTAAPRAGVREFSLQG